MRISLPVVLVLCLALGADRAMHAQIANPIAAPIVKRGLSVAIRDVVRLPDTRALRPADQDVVPAGWARVSYVRDLPDGRRFANDSRGLLYLLDRNNQPSVYANVGTTFPLAVYNRLESGFVGFDFHPEFARNGLFYTVHAERAKDNPAAPNFIPPGFTPADVTYHNVITEWRATNPSSNTFEGTRRELLRVAHIVNNLTHPFGHVEFNPAAKPGAPDYGLLYTSGSDLGTAREQSRPDTAAGHGDRRDSAHRSTQSLRLRRHQGAGGLHDSTAQQVRRGSRSEDARRDLRVRIPERTPAVLGSGRRDDVCVGHRDEQHRGNQHRS
jgi:hypothetical protein